MLSFDAVHALTDCLLDADAHAEALGWNTSPVLLLLHDRPLPPHTTPRPCGVTGVAFALSAEQWLAHSARIPAVLADLAAHLRVTPNHPTNQLVTNLGAVAGLALTPEGRTRLLAWAVLYEDVRADATAVCQVRRVDAVDVDGRVYQISRFCGDAQPLVTIDDQPDPDDTPATQPGLAALVDATHRQPTSVHKER